MHVSFSNHDTFDNMYVNYNMFPLQMATFEASLEKTYDKPIESKRRDLKIYREKIKFNEEKESKDLIKIELKQEEDMLENRRCMYFLQIMFNLF